MFRHAKPEVMSPAGYWPQLHAAVEAGADAVYFGLKHFTARAKVGFSLAELPEVMRTLHARGVRGFVTFNTLVFEHELDEAVDAIAAIVEAGADALIVQDVGIATLARRIAPEAELHASTQMSVTCAEGVVFAQRLGVKRVTLARELSLQEIRAIRAATDCELEIFVHGALCVAYSGQCFSSEAWGGRSANRGQCAQACRLPYEMWVDGKQHPLGDARYLLSPGDLYALRQIPEITEIGISALKIEGRYKDADYVALATRAYRKAVDEAWAGLPQSVTAAGEVQLAQVYSRTPGPYFVSGTNHQAVVTGRSPRHQGVLIGRVAEVSKDSVVIEPTAVHRLAPIKPGDGLVFDAAGWRSPEKPEEGGRIFGIETRGSRLELRFGRESIDFDRIRKGDLVWRSHDPELDRLVKPMLEAGAPVRRQPVQVTVSAAPGKPLRTVWSLIEHPGVQVEAESQEPLAEALHRGLTVEFLRDQLGRLGNTAYALRELELNVEGSPFAPASLLNQVRRDAVRRLRDLQIAHRSGPIEDPGAILASALAGIVPAPRTEPPLPRLHLLVRTPEQLEAAIALAPASVTLDYLDLYGLRPSVERVRTAEVEVRVASPRVFKPGEERIVEFLLRLGCPILVRSSGLLERLREVDHPPLIGDFSLNAANSITAGLARSAGADRIEAVAYQHMPVFHTEHCVFCRFLSTGTSYKDCGRPCDVHRVELRDVAGRAHPVMADVGCRNTVFGAEAQEASAYLEDWLAAGIHHFRLEFVHETPTEVTGISRSFAAALNGQQSFAELSQDLRRRAPQGTTRGSLFVAADYRSLPVLQ